MCGIFASISSNAVAQGSNIENLYEKADLVAHRGPDGSYRSVVVGKSTTAFCVFHRLSIMGQTHSENNILNDNGVYMICNGEIYRHENYAQRYGLQLTTKSDCEVILKVYTDYMQKQTNLNVWDTVEYFKEAVSRLDGDFAFVLWDSNKEILLAGRDRIGVRPLFYNDTYNVIQFASEEKALSLTSETKQFLPGHVMFQQRGFSAMVKYWDTPPQLHLDLNTTKTIINTLLIDSVKKRLVSDRPIGFLLSGGLDSSLVASIASKFVDVTTFSIGYPDSPDLLAARKVAAYLGSRHHEVILTDNDIKNSLKDLIWSLGCYDITTIRASMPMYILSKYISQHTDIKVLFSGEGADELFAGYLYLKRAPDLKSLQDDIIRLVKELYLFDVRRADRSTARWGLELRVPFLDADFVQFILGLDPYLKNTAVEKKILRDSFEGYLPTEILYRRKEAFSDGVGSRSVALLKQLAEGVIVNSELSKGFAEPKTDEAKLYYNIFKEFFAEFNDTTHYWMPKWCPEAGNDPSATVLSHY